jgi:hypothetical protein
MAISQGTELRLVWANHQHLNHQCPFGSASYELPAILDTCMRDGRAAFLQECMTLLMSLILHPPSPQIQMNPQIVSNV